MALKFYLNKFGKVDNIENYTLKALKGLQDEFSKFLDDSGGVDPDFPMFDFGGKGKKVNGRNSSLINEED